jgi:hypothetical protein
VESNQIPCRSFRLLQLPLHFESLPSKRCKFIKHGRHTSSYQTCDSTRMSTELSHQDSGSLSTPIPTIVNGTPSTPATTMVVVTEAPIINVAHPIVNTQPISMNPFGSFCHSSGYNVQSILMASSPFSYGMANFTSHFSNSILAARPNSSIGLGAHILLILHSCLVALRSLKRFLQWEEFLLLTLRLFMLLLDGVTNLVDKIFLKFHPLLSPPQY